VAGAVRRQGGEYGTRPAAGPIDHGWRPDPAGTTRITQLRAKLLRDDAVACLDELLDLVEDPAAEQALRVLVQGR
jgi:hypothetical protein